jgi:hypothetical protein
MAGSPAPHETSRARMPAQLLCPVLARPGSDSTDEFRLLKHCGRDGSSGGRGGYLKKSLDRNTTGPLASTGPSKNLRDARSSIASRSRTN